MLYSREFSFYLHPGESVASFISWLNSVTGAVPAMYHIVGHHLGGHQAGIVGRNLGGQVTYITGKPILRWPEVCCNGTQIYHV